MRLRLAAAALAALTMAAPAAAQPALEAVRGMLQRMDANTEGVRDYTLTLRSGALQSEVFVYRDGDAWEVATPEDEQLGGMLRGMVVWPSFHAIEDGAVSELMAEEVDEAFVASSETLNGRPVDVVSLRLEGLMLEESELPDSARLYLDPADRQILRVQVRGLAADVGDMAPEGGRMDMVIDFADYRQTDGLTVPHSLRLSMNVELDLSDDQRAAMQAGVAAARAELQEDDSEEGRQTAALIDIFLGLLNDGHMEIPATVESVRVNAGAPSWFEG